MVKSFQFIISPPVKKPHPAKIIETPEELPKLILAPFNFIPEVKFGEVGIYSKATKSLTIYNPAKVTFTVSIPTKFSNFKIRNDRIS